MTVTCYLTIVGARQGKFKGESNAPGHQDAIEALSTGYLIAVPFDIGTGQPTGVLEHAPFQFTKASGAATPQLLEAAVTNEQIQTVTIDFVQRSPVDEVVESIVISNARIVTFEHHLDATPTAGNGELLDDVRMVFETFQITNTVANTSATDNWPERS
jgi:type VI secretion system secreted protein Hcp